MKESQSSHSQGISQATAISFAKEDCRKLVLADRNTEGLQRTKTLIKEAAEDAQVLIHPTDVSKAEQLDQLVEAAVKQFGRIDYAVNGAGTALPQTTTMDSLTR